MKLAIAVMSLGVAAAGVVVGGFTEPASDHGKEVYAMQKCALCHSISGIGGKKHALDGVGTRLKADDIKKWIRDPKSMKPDTTMKAYPNLPEKDLADLVAYLSSLKLV